jgi:excinuclease UvrABC nuclease subunit
MTDWQKFLDDLNDLAHKHDVSQAKVSDMAHAKLPACGVYFLFQDYEVVYVGKSTNIYTRLASHQGWKHKEWNRVAAIECDREILGAVEYAMIAAFQPKYNRSIITQ